MSPRQRYYYHHAILSGLFSVFAICVGHAVSTTSAGLFSWWLTGVFLLAMSLVRMQQVHLQEQIDNLKEELRNARKTDDSGSR